MSKKNKANSPQSKENQVVETPVVTVETPQVPKNQVVTARRSSYPFGDLVASAAVSAEIPRSYAYKCIKAFLEEAKSLISQGHSVNFAQFGSFDARVIHAKTMRTPQGKLITTSDRVRVRFHNSSKMNELMDAVGVKALEKQGFTPIFKIPQKTKKVLQDADFIEDAADAELAELSTEDFDV